MDVNNLVSDSFKIQSEFRWPKVGIKYLGIYITPDFNNLYKANYEKNIRNIRNDLERWSSLPLSLLGRVESVRMNVLP